jgi:hypothetical protein
MVVQALFGSREMNEICVTAHGELVPPYRLWLAEKLTTGVTLFK